MNPLIIVVIGLIQFGIIITNVIFFKKLLSFFNANIPTAESYRVVLRSSLINFFGFLQGGTGYRAFYAKKHYGINYKKFALLFAANSIIVFLVCALIGLLGTVLYAINTSSTNIGVILFFIAISLAMITLVIIRPGTSVLKTKKLSRINEILIQWRSLTANTSFLRFLVILSVIQFFLSTTLYGLELMAIGHIPSFIGLLGYTAIANLSIVIAFTPGAIGLRESLLVFSQGALGVSTSDILLGATIDRIVYFMLLGVLSLSMQLRITKGSKKND